MKRVITYGTYDLLHIGHLSLLQRARELGDYLIVGVSTDEFNRAKGKEAVCSYRERSALVSALRCVDLVIPERSWEQKADDVDTYGVAVFAMGDDWKGELDSQVAGKCEVVYLPRTPRISTSQLIRGIVTQRIAARTATQVRCRVQVRDVVLDGTTVDVSFAGSRLRVDDPGSPHEVRAGTAVVLVLGDDPMLEVPGVIVRVDDREISIQHAELPSATRNALAVFLVAQSYGGDGSRTLKI